MEADAKEDWKSNKIDQIHDLDKPVTSTLAPMKSWWLAGSWVVTQWELKEWIQFSMLLIIPSPEILVYFVACRAFSH